MTCSTLFASAILLAVVNQVTTQCCCLPSCCCENFESDLEVQHIPGDPTTSEDDDQTATVRADKPWMYPGAQSPAWSPQVNRYALPSPMYGITPGSNPPGNPGWPSAPTPGYQVPNPYYNWAFNLLQTYGFRINPGAMQTAGALSVQEGSSAGDGGVAPAPITDTNKKREVYNINDYSIHQAYHAGSSMTQAENPSGVVFNAMPHFDLSGREELILD